LPNLLDRNLESALAARTMQTRTKAAAYALSLTSGIADVERKNTIVGRVAAESVRDVGTWSANPAV